MVREELFLPRMKIRTPVRCLVCSLELPSGKARAREEENDRSCWHLDDSGCPWGKRIDDRVLDVSRKASRRASRENCLEACCKLGEGGMMIFQRGTGTGRTNATRVDGD
jgi:hypothetical protein